MAAIKPGLIMGTAPMANYWLFRTEAPGESVTEEYNWIRGAEFADSVGCDILTTSLGYTEFDDPSMNHTYATLNGRTAPMSIAANLAARKGMFVINSAGNERANSWHFISVAADADSVCAAGAVDTLGKAAAFSSVGPTADGRIKPDLSTRGAGTWVSETDLTCFPANGTSFSAPVLAGAVACYWQMHRGDNNIRILNMLKRTASRATEPDNDIGWGIPNLCSDNGLDFTVFFDRKTSVIRVSLDDGNYDKIELQVVDYNGKQVFRKTMAASERDFRIDAAGYAQGIYVIRMITSQGSKAKKIVR
jgi:hypothetical protein